MKKYGCLFIILLFSLFYFIGTNEEASSIQSLDTKLLVSKYAEQYVSYYLKDTKTATYQTNCILQDNLAGVFECRVVSNSKNSFGVYRKSSFDLSIKYDVKNQSIYLISLEY